MFNVKQLLIVLILAGVSFGVADSYLVAHYKLDDNADSTVVLDSSGNGYHGTSIRNTSLMHTTGKIGGALSFDGTNDYIDTGNTFNTIFKNDFTVSLWVNANDGRKFLDQQLFCILERNEWTEPLACVQCTMGFGEGTLLVSYVAGDGKSVLVGSLTPVFPDGPTNWHFISFTVQQVGTKIKISSYFDGILVESSISFDDISMTDYASTMNPFIGAGNNEGYPADAKFTGNIDDIRIYNKALSATEVLSLYEEALKNRIDYRIEKRSRYK